MVRWLAVLLVTLAVGCQTPSVAPAPVVEPTVSLFQRPRGAGRVDVLNAADAAFAHGDLTTASGLYERVLTTPAGAEHPPGSRRQR